MPAGLRALAAPAGLLVLLARRGCSAGGGEPACSGAGGWDRARGACQCPDGFAGDACEACADGFVGWPSCERKPGELATGWAQLCAEAGALRAAPPDFVAHLGRLYEARQWATAGGSLKRRRAGHFWGSAVANCSSGGGGSGPWRLKVDLAPPRGAPPVYRKDHRVVLVFGPDWPTALPTIRFVGKLKSCYARESDREGGFGQNLHTAEANGLLLRRLHERAGATVRCMWRQTGGCDGTGGPREPEKDQLCSFEVPAGASGFCDCDGDGLKGRSEPAFGCDDASPPGRQCERACGASARRAAASAAGAPRHGLRQVLQALHEMFGAPLDARDRRSWSSAADGFKEEASTVLKYQTYGRLHPELFRAGGVPEEEAVDPELLGALRRALAEPSREEARRRLLSSGLVAEVVGGLVFSFRVLRPDFCEKLMQEIRHFYGSKLPARRPNSMNNYGIILNEIGLEPLVFGLQDAVIQPLAAILLPVEGSELESHHSFTIRYRGGEDTHLDVHTDDSDITFNVNIFGNYSGAPLVFCGLNGEPDHRHFRAAYQHELGFAVLHRGRHRHGAEDITSGERMNLVVWSYSHAFRSSRSSQKRHQVEKGPPDRRCVSYTHDRDFSSFREFPPGKKAQFFGRGWCPPRGKEYPGFKPDVSEDQRRAAGSGAAPGGGGQ